MLVSHDYKFILVKTKKTAGSSIQEYLKPYCTNGHVTDHHPESHMGAEQIRDLVGEQVWNEYLKICPVRNPWDKMVSLYYWRSRKRPTINKIRRFLMLRFKDDLARKMNFPDYMKYVSRTEGVNIDKSVIYLDGQLPDYEFIRFENLHEDLQKVCEKIGIAYDPERLPQKKTGRRRTKGYRDLYTDESKELVRHAYALEIERFGYEF